MEREGLGFGSESLGPLQSTECEIIHKQPRSWYKSYRNAVFLRRACRRGWRVTPREAGSRGGRVYRVGERRGSVEREGKERVDEARA
eukprot:1386880-Rhodomonas_salina.1